MNTTDILIAALRGADLRVGDGEPRDVGGVLTDRYCVVRPRIQTAGPGTAVDPNADRNPEIQITAVGPSRLAADQVAEQAGQIALGPLTAPDGQSWMCAPEYITGTGPTPEQSTDPTAPEAPAYFRIDVYRYYLTPA